MFATLQVYVSRLPKKATGVPEEPANEQSLVSSVVNAVKKAFQSLKSSKMSEPISLELGSPKVSYGSTAVQPARS